MPHALNIISANDLRDGLNVYFIQNGGNARWDRDISLATIYDEDELSTAFDRAKQDMDNNIVVDCIIVPVDDNHNPVTTRERIRAGGPSVKYGTQVTN